MSEQAPIDIPSGPTTTHSRKSRMTPERVLELTAPVPPEEFSSRPYLVRDPEKVTAVELSKMSDADLLDYARAALTMEVYRAFPVEVARRY